MNCPFNKKIKKKKLIFKSFSEMNILNYSFKLSSEVRQDMSQVLCVNQHWPLPWCAGPLCAGSSSENPGCIALQSGSDGQGLWVPFKHPVDNPQQGCHQVMPQREAVPLSHGTPQPSALHPKVKKRSNVMMRLLLIWFMQWTILTMVHSLWISLKDASIKIKSWIGLKTTTTKKGEPLWTINLKYKNSFAMNSIKNIWEKIK